MIIRYKVHTGFAGGEYTGELEFDDNVTDDQIMSAVLEDCGVEINWNKVTE